MELVHKNGNFLLKVVNDILDYSKISQHKLQLENQVFHLPKLIDEITKTNVILFKKGVHFTKTVLLPLDVEYVIGDPHRLNQCISNLLSNAAKFTKEGNVKLSCKVHKIVDGDHLELEFEIRDTGIGLTKEVQHSLFVPFSQGDPCITREFGGTGLGLAITKQLVSLMNGTIQVTSEVGKGTAFTFTVQLKKTSHRVQQPKRQLEILLESTPKHILVVEDNYFNTQLIARMLSTLHHTFVTVTNGKDAIIELATSPPFNLILMDLQMPEMGGIEAATKIHKSGCTVPIIAMSANTDEKTQIEAFKGGMADFLPKPFTLDQLKVMIMKHNNSS